MIHEVCWKNPDGTYGREASSVKVPQVPPGAIQVDFDELNEPKRIYQDLLDSAAERAQENAKLAEAERKRTFQELVSLGLSREAATRLTGYQGD